MDEIDALLAAQASGKSAPAQMDEIDAMLAQQASGKTASASAAPAGYHPKYGAIGNTLVGATMGLADLVHAPAQLALNGVNSIAQKISPDSDASGYIKGKTDQFNQYLKELESDYQATTPGSVGAGIGRVIGNVAPFVATGGGSAVSKLPKSLQYAKALGQGAATSMATQPVTNVVTGEDGSNNFLWEKAKQGAFGAGGAAAGRVIGKGLDAIANPKVSAEAAAALKEGITPTMGQMLGGKVASLENKATSLGFGVGDLIKKAQKGTTLDFNKAAYNRALAPIGKSAKGITPGNEGVLAVKEALSGAYDDVLNKVKFKGDAQFGEDLTRLATIVNNGNVPPQVAAQFNSIIKNNVLSRMTKNGTMDGKQYKVLESDLLEKAKKFGAGDASQQEVAGALNEVVSLLKTTLSRSNPDQAQALANINKGWANYTRIRAAAAGTGTDNGVFTPAQLASAVKALDKSKGKGDFATGQALMQDLARIGKNVAPTYPDSGTAGRIGEMATGGALLLNPQYIAPALLGAGLVSAPYTQAGKQLAAKLLTQRPESAAVVGRQLEGISPALGAVLAGSSVPLFGN